MLQYFNTRIVAVLVFASTAIALRLLADTLTVRMDSIILLLGVASASFMLLPLACLLVVVTIVPSVLKLGLKVNPNLVEDYVDGCLTVLFLAVAELLLVLAYVYTGSAFFAFNALALFASMLTVSVILVLGLTQVARQLLLNIATKAQTP